MENDNEVLDPQKNETETTENPVEETTEQEETVTIPKKELDTLKAQKEHWRDKANKKPDAPEKEEKGNILSTKDIVALTKVPEDDVDDVIDYAKFKKIPIAEALKSSTVKALLAEKAEQRQTAEATNTGTARRSNAKLTGEALIKNANSGKLPESDDEIRELLRAKIASIKK